MSVHRASGAKVTKTSNSLLEVKSSRNSEPNNANSVIFQRDQKEVISSLGISSPFVIYMLFPEYLHHIKEKTVILSTCLNPKSFVAIFLVPEHLAVDI